MTFTPMLGMSAEEYEEYKSRQGCIPEDVVR
jgi:hypothetical protein